MDLVSFGIGVLASIAGTVLVYVFAATRGWAKGKLAVYVRHRNLSLRMNKAGIANFYASRTDFTKYRSASDLSDYVAQARFSIKIAAFWMAHGNESEGIAQRLADLVRGPNAIEVEVAIINPNGSCVQEIARYLKISVDELRARTIGTLTNLRRAREELEPGLQDKFEIRVYNTLPVMSVIMLDSGTELARTQIEIKPYEVPRQFSFAFELRPPGPLHDLCTKSALKLIADGEAFDEQAHIAEL